MRAYSITALRSLMAAISGAFALFLLSFMPAFAANHEAEETVKAAMAAEGRFEQDLARDAMRRPEKVLSFFGVSEGMHVLDLFSGGGYYTELVSSLVGPDGAVLAHNNNAYLAFVKDELEARYTPGRLENVKHAKAEANDLEIKEGHFDAALFVLGYHDIYYVDDGWPEIDGPGLLAKILKGLKPGGILGIIDHSAVAGAPHSVGTTLHRIDPAIVRAEIEAAGFVFDGEIDALRNPDDPLEVGMFDESVSGKTDRFIYKFVKPAS